MRIPCCDLQGLVMGEDKKLHCLREQAEAEIKEADTARSTATQAHRQLRMLQQAAEAAQHSMHSVPVSPYASMHASPERDTGHAGRQAPAYQASTELNPTRHSLPPWREISPWHCSDQALDGDACRRETYTHQQSLEQMRLPGSSPIRLTAGHWQYQPNSGSAYDAHRGEHAQRQRDSMHQPGTSLSVLQQKLCSAEAEVTRLRSQLRIQRREGNRHGVHLPRDNPGQAEPSIEPEAKCRDGIFTASCAIEEEKTSSSEKGLQKLAAYGAPLPGACAELASVSAQVAQQRSVLHQLTSQVLQVLPFLPPIVSGHACRFWCCHASALPQTPDQSRAVL